MVEMDSKLSNYVLDQYWDQTQTKIRLMVDQFVELLVFENAILSKSSSITSQIRDWKS
jgi:hypothetical protein